MRCTPDRDSELTHGPHNNRKSKKIMKWQDYKYLIAYVAPLSAFLGIYLQGIWSFAGIYVGFGLIPLFDALSRPDPQNFTDDEEQRRKLDRFFDLLLYLNLPILYLLVIYYLHTVQQGGLATYEIVGMTCSVGLMLGTSGINVAHELGHRSNPQEQLLGKLLLLPPLYLHFNIEHNRGHHRNVATDLDPASARRNEPLYLFWLRSVVGSYRNAWKLEAERLQKMQRKQWSWANEMIRFTIAKLLYLTLIGLVFGWEMIPYAIAIAVFGFLMLESVNYIEHYGLRRQLLPSGRYETVKPIHSWNSDHEVGRIFLYELTRHADHHYRASRKYQTLRHFDESPQLPYGYPASILLSLLPPLWFRLMNPRLAAFEQQHTTATAD